MDVGDVVERYVVERRLGQGGMAAVYAVRHAVLGTRHALKVLLVSPRALRERLVREGRIQAHLDPAHVVPVTDVLDVDGAPALLMPYVPGCSLAELMRERRLEEAEIADLLRQIALGLADAHAAGVVHRDLKPANVLLEVKGGAVVARVADFGVAHYARDVALTPSGVGIGTPLYSAPEQSSDAATVDARTDIWSLGVLAYEMLTGRWPFDAEGSLADAIARGHDADALPERWRPWLSTMLAVDRERRGPGAAVFADAMRAWASPVVGEVAAFILARGELPATIDPARTWHGDDGGTAASRSRTPALPAEADAFLGRTEDLAGLRAHLASGARLLTLFGMGGAGKTRLAVHMAWSEARRDGVWFCDLTEATDARGIAAAVAAAISVPLAGADPVGQIGHAIAARGQCLILLDNFEQVAAHAATTVGRWLERAPDARFLVTSRSVLGIPGETVVEVGPLAPDDAIALFDARARAGDAAYVADPDTVRGLVDLLDRLPLAIELAAARVRLLSPRDLVSRVRQRFRLLAGGAGRQPRHATLRATIDWSWQLLSADEQRALCYLTVFDGGFSLAAAEFVLARGDEWPADWLGSLRDKSMLRGGARMDLAGSIRDFGLEQLDAHGWRADAEARHGQWFSRYGDPERLGPYLRLGEAGAVDPLFVDLGNLVGALRRAVARHDVAVALATLRAALGPLLDRGPASQALDLANLAATLDAGPVEAAELHLAVARAARAARARGIPAALALAVAAARRSGDAALLALTLSEQALHLSEIGEAEHARATYEAAIGAAASLPDMVIEGKIRGRLAMLFGQNGDYAALDAESERALHCARRAGDLRTQASIWSNLGVARFREGRHHEATAAYEQALAHYQEIGYQPSQAVVLGNLANVYNLADRPEAARAAYASALKICRQTGDARTQAIVLGNLGTLDLALGQIEAGIAGLEAGRALAASIGAAQVEGTWLAHLSLAQARLGQFEAARARSREAQARLLDPRDPYELTRMFVYRAEIERRAGERIAAQAALAAADALAAELHLEAESELAKLLADARAVVCTDDTQATG